MTDVTEEQVTVTVTIDGREIDARPGELVIAAAERHGVHIPRFCWHPRMPEVGMCRMCIVEIDTGRGPALQPSCMVPVSDGMTVDTQSDTTKKAQDGILEFLLINHPLDCPVCDKGGECPLQDQTLSFGPGETRMVEEKRHYEKPIPISDLVFLDRERCILCDRCTRFADEIAGDPLIHFLDRGNQTQVNTFPDDPFSSYFSGNTVQICPVGALTASSYRFKARPWDLEEAESTCTTCSVGCRVATQSSRNEVVRVLGVDTDPLDTRDGLRPVNEGWLCDRGRFDFESLNSEHRLRVPLVRDTADADALVEASWPGAITAAADGIRAAIDEHGADSVAVLGGARLTNEAAYAWSKLARSVIGTDHVDAQLGDGLPADLVLGLPRATVDDACTATTLLWIGPDPKEELPVLHLRLRAAVKAGTVRIVELTPHDTALTPLSKLSVRYRPGELAQAVAGLLGGGGPDVGGADADALGRAKELLDEGSLVVALGRTSIAESVDPTVEGALALADAYPEATFLPLLRRGNVNGALAMGLAPGVLPGATSFATGRDHWAEHWGDLPAEAGLDAAGILDAAANGRIRALVLVGADPLGDCPDRDLARRALAGAGFVASIDTLPSESTLHADVVLAASAWGESPGTTTNLEGRVTSLSQKVTPPGTARADWMLAADLATALGGDLGIASFDDLAAEIASTVPGHARISDVDATDGVLALHERGDAVPLVERPSIEATSPVPVDAYSLRLVVARKLYDDAVSTRYSDHLAPLAPGAVLRLSPYDFDRVGVGSGGQLQVTSDRGTVVLTVGADPAVPDGVALLAANQSDVAAEDLIELGARLTKVRVETL
ncbi:MAG: NADH-quinone oxidoreductase subunit NuoG [Actinomycetota bacterium]